MKATTILPTACLCLVAFQTGQQSQSAATAVPLIGSKLAEHSDTLDATGSPALDVSRRDTSALASPDTTVPSEPPFSFEQNLGQADERVAFLARGLGYVLYLSNDSALLALAHAEHRTDAPLSAGTSDGHRGDKLELLRLELVGANPRDITGVDQVPGKSHYLIGRDPSGWHTDVPHFGSVRYNDIYTGIDFVYYGKHGRLEYDFVVAAGADPNQVRLRFDGARSVTVGADGALVVEMANGDLFQHAPVVYQTDGGVRQPIPGGYVLHGANEVGFEIGEYDSSRALVIDPVIVWATYYGGSNLDVVHQAKVDPTGHVYLGGRTLSVNLPVTAGAFDETFNPAVNAAHDGFVAKLAPDGASLVYATYIGGTGPIQFNDSGDTVFGLDVDAGGHVYITGETDSKTDFPITPGAYQTTYGGFLSDVYVAKLRPDGSSLVYSTYLGRNGQDIGTHVAVDALGQAHVAVRTTTTQSGGPQWPTTPGSVDPSLNGDWDAAVAKLSADGSMLLWSTFLGGSGGDHTGTIALDAAGNVHVTGITNSSNFPTTAGAYDRTKAGSSSTNDAWAVKISADGTTLMYSTLLGGTGNDTPSRLALDASGNLHITGSTTGAFPVTAGAFQPVYGGGAVDGFLAKLSSDGSRLLYSSYLGGSASDATGDLVFDSAGNLWVSGSTASLDFPTTPGSFPHAGSSDGYVALFDSTLTSLLFSTPLGGSGSDGVGGVGLDAAGGVYAIGNTNSTDIPVTAGAFQTSFGGGSFDVFVHQARPADRWQSAAVGRGRRVQRGRRYGTGGGRAGGTRER